MYDPVRMDRKSKVIFGSDLMSIEPQIQESLYSWFEVGNLAEMKEVRGHLSHPTLLSNIT